MNGHYIKYKEYYSSYHKKYYIRNKEKILEQCGKYNKENKENRKEYHKQWYQRNRKNKLGQNEQWRKDNPDKMREYVRKWRKTEKGKALNQRTHIKRRIRERNIINTLTAEEWISILKKYKFRCAYCGCEFTLFNRVTRDHVIPISKGGHNTKENVVPACVSCNSKKKDKILEGRNIS